MASEWDLVVVGAGTAGLPAAIFAARRGMRVLAVEKSHQVGGTLYLSGGQMSAAGTRHQQRHGVEDSPDEHFRDVMAFSEGTANRDLVRLATGNAAATIDWLDDLGFDISPECPAPTVHFHHNPYSKARMHWGTRAGYSILDLVVPEFESVVADGSVEPALNTSLVALDRSGEGEWRARIKGPDGEREHTSRAVALTAGGYTANPELFREVSQGRLVSSRAADGHRGRTPHRHEVGRQATERRPLAADLRGYRGPGRTASGCPHRLLGCSNTPGPTALGSVCEPSGKTLHVGGGGR